MKQLIGIMLILLWAAMPVMASEADSPGIPKDIKERNRIMELYREKLKKGQESLSSPGEQTDTSPSAGKSSATDEATNSHQSPEEEPTASQNAEKTGTETEDYIIGPGDVLAISIWKDDALTRRVTVLPDGTITFPLIGRIEAAGKTLPQFRDKIEKEIGYYVPDPVLSISIEQVNSMLVYVIGKVNKPGRFLLNAHTDVLQMLAMSGGLNAFAKRNKIRIFRRNAHQTTVFDFNYEDVSEGIHPEQNIYLKRGDVIVVP